MSIDRLGPVAVMISLFLSACGRAPLGAPPIDRLTEDRPLLNGAVRCDPIRALVCERRI